uniref:NADH dehydrogenase subunit 6 n=1 Tax=Oxytelus tibetanus TaxID=3078933 RepID=UPI002A8245A4|nr:NADH dehydrogenase subunit 6 [Oxytelus tibetanus]WON66079.1 NADH dehydrogenase subunit 6 [Oxytelus tibetanus]
MFCMSLILILMVNLSIMFLFSKHPITMGVILLMQTLMTCFLMNAILLNSWFSYILLLIMIGGLLILFIYMTSLVSNEKFKFSPFLLFMNLITMMIIMVSFMFDQFNMTLLNKSFTMMKYSLNMNFNKFLMPSYLTMIILIIYLLIVLIAVVKISSFKTGPLRQKF